MDLDDSTPDALAAAKRAAAAAGQPSPARASAAASAPSSAPFGAGASLFAPSSFSSSLAAHPFLAGQRLSPQPLNAHQPPASGAPRSPAPSAHQPPSFSLHAAAAASSASPSGPLRDPKTGALAGSYASMPTASSKNKKRSSEQFHDAHVGEKDVAEKQVAKAVRAEDDSDDEAAAAMDGPASLLSPSQEEMADEDALDAPGRGKNERAAMAADDEDSSFMSLLSKLAKLEFPSGGAPEKCPLCPLTFPLAQFASHVYTCLSKLDTVEKAEQERLDAKLAIEIAFDSPEEPRFGGGRRHPHSSDRPRQRSTEMERQLLEKFARDKEQQQECRYGSQCNRTDARHFQQLHHPEVPCPICNGKFAPYEIDAHITMCLTAPQQHKPAADSMTDDAPKASAAAASASPSAAFSSKTISIPSLAGASASSASAIPRRSRKLSQRSASASNVNMGGSQSQDAADVLSPPMGLQFDDDDAAADDEADDEEEQKQHHHQSPPASMMRAEDDSGLRRSNSDCSLSLAQASAVANLVLQKKAAARVKQADGSNEKDPSLLDLLSTFSSLGFTRENLEAMHAKHVEEGANK